MRFFSSKTCGRQAKKFRSYASRPMAFRNFRGICFEPLEEQAARRKFDLARSGKRHQLDGRDARFNAHDHRL